MHENVVSLPPNPAPKNLAKKVLIEPEFSWDESPAAQYYEFYIWKTKDQQPEEPVITGLNDNQDRLHEELEGDTVYIWRVRTVGRYGEGLIDP